MALEPSSLVRRYTNLASAIHILRTQKLTLLDPRTWDDRNDAFFLEKFRDEKKAKSVLALCFAQSTETYHHWKVFSPGSDGICIIFKRAPLTRMLRLRKEVELGSIRIGPIKYLRLSQIGQGYELEKLPFTKRYGYKDEQEWRVIYTSHHQECVTYQVGIELSAIDRIVLSPWTHPDLAESITETIREIDGCKKLNVVRSTLIEDERWKRHAKHTKDRPTTKNLVLRARTIPRPAKRVKAL